MSKRSSHHESHEHPDEPNAGPHARPIHHSWIFWVGLVLTLAAILTYVLTLDLSTRPGVRVQQPTPGKIIGTP